MKRILKGLNSRLKKYWIYMKLKEEERNSDLNEKHNQLLVE